MCGFWCVAAHFVETCVAKYEGFLRQATSSLPVLPSPGTSLDTPASLDIPATGGEVFTTQGPGKELLNLLTLISELYNFQVISCVLVYDIIRGLLAGDVDEGGGRREGGEKGERGEGGEVGELGVEGVLRVVRSEYSFPLYFPLFFEPCPCDFFLGKGGRGKEG